MFRLFRKRDTRPRRASLRAPQGGRAGVGPRAQLKKMTLLAGAACCLVARPMYAQTPPTPMTFDAAIQRAIEKNPTVSQASLAILRAEAVLQQSRGAARPTAYATAVNTTLDNQRGFNGGVTQPQNQTVVGFDVTVPLIQGTQWAAIAQSKDQIEVAQISLADVRRQIAVATAETYLGVLVLRRQVDVNTRALEAAKAHLDYAQKRLAGGAGTRLNELRAAQEVSTDEARLENSRLAVRRAQEALGVLLANNGPVDAADDPTFDMPAPADEASWLAARTDIKLLTAQQRAADRIVRDSKKDAWPIASASFDPQFVGPSGLFQPSKTWRFSISFTQVLFEGGQRKSVMAQRRLSFDQVGVALTAAEIQARADARIAREAAESGERALTSTRLAATQANEVVRITTAAFEAGATSNIEVIDAQRIARDAETAVTIAEDGAKRARLDLLIALGRFPR